MNYLLGFVNKQLSVQANNQEEQETQEQQQPKPQLTPGDDY